jgi:hypothetical protein
MTALLIIISVLIWSGWALKNAVSTTPNEEFLNQISLILKNQKQMSESRKGRCSPGIIGLRTGSHQINN